MEFFVRGISFLFPSMGNFSGQEVSNFMWSLSPQPLFPPLHGYTCCVVSLDGFGHLFQTPSVLNLTFVLLIHEIGCLSYDLSNCHMEMILPGCKMGSRKWCTLLSKRTFELSLNSALCC